MAISLTESLQIGVNDILMRKVRSLITIFGIVLGVMCIMVVLAIIAGMNKSTMAWMQERGGTNKVEIERNWDYDFRGGGYASLTLAELNQVRGQIPEALAVGPVINSWGASLQYKGFSYSGQVLGVLPGHQRMESWYPGKGRFFSDIEVRENSNVIVLGATVAKELFKTEDPLGQSVMLSDQMLTVIGIMQEKIWESPGGGSFGGNALEYMNRQSFVPISTMMNKIEASSLIQSVQILAKSPEDALMLQEKLKLILLHIKKGKAVFRVSSAQETIQQMQQNSKIFSMIFIMIGMISLLVGGIVIMNIMLASIKERTREIGVRLAIGARRTDIFVQFMVQTVLITGLGGVFGIILGYLILDLVSGYLGMPMLAGPQMILVSLLVSVGVGLIFGIAPAVKASNLDPVMALRDE
ncbi:MAG: ABC transporter permease [Candidatus Cloacimonetes bacterium]|jgi:ABC-type antimicrobial peptide transport system permease subunit|nr:ABC transporter permease [Candidatus Cloacimonadota bacterium]MCB5286988.1 ABC transporter permease [Candidatus Cloacimonadota bacterium]MCK9183856.1 ABC transporter permease [Candidatus Cloacimonadota bacterium]MCK9583914.1 ABC transporter permease [Candidatus Cloacimonadota bacterium]MDY0229308.1 ABC transporter permease [Candidatus Cloacimonadaceae bacterium]